MQIQKIRFKNINSLKGEHTIDFQEKPLSSAGLFAITGATGSGKTTILDVITLALFCRIPRVSEAVTKGFIEKTGLILTRNMGEAMAEVTYACNEGVFTSQWSISTNRNGNLRDYEMQISTAEGEILDVKRSDVPACNEAHIGLNFEQFVKAIILAQGDFAAFLKANKNERGRLLEKVTGTWIYRELGKAAYLKNKTLGHELERLQGREFSLREQLMPEDDFQKLLNDTEQTEKSIAACQVLIDQFKGQEKLKADIAVLLKKVGEAEAQLLAVGGKYKTFSEAYADSTAKHARLLPHQKKLWNWKGLNDKLKVQEKELNDLKQKLLGCAAEEDAVKGEVKNLTLSDAPITQALEVFQKKVLEVQNKLAEAETLRQSAARTVWALADEISLPIHKTDPEKARLQLADEKNLTAHELERLTAMLPGDSHAEPKKKQAELRAAAETLQSLIAETTFMQSKQQQLTQLQKEASELKLEMEAIPDMLVDVTNNHKQAELELKGLEKDKKIRDLTASLEEHRQKLVDGQPCPLCGATHHPFSEGLMAGQDDLEQKILDASRVNDELKKSIHTLELNLANGQKSFTKKQLEISELETAVKLFNEKIYTLRDALPQNCRLEEPGNTLSRIKQEIENIEQYVVHAEKNRKLVALAVKVKEWGQYVLSATALSESLQSIFPGKDVLAVTQKLQERYTGNNARQQKLLQDQLALQENHQAVQNDFQALTGQLVAELVEYDSPAAALSDLMDDGDYARLQNEGNQLKQEINSIESGLNVHGENLKDLKEKDTDTSLEELQKLRLAQETESREQNNLRDGFKGKQRVQEKIVEDIQALQKDIAAQKNQNEKWVLLSKYIGDAEGKRFSTFAQELTLLQLVSKASKRLELLNDRYLLAIPEEGEDDSLAVIDTHMGDMRRSVKSLSGGETFLVSLALALALSDLAAHKVEIKSLFIDEGFGSLDKLTLDQTMDTLEKLQYETNKTIGVISHVEAMQERITTQIKLEKGGQGHSKLVVV